MCVVFSCVSALYVRPRLSEGEWTPGCTPGPSRDPWPAGAELRDRGAKGIHSLSGASSASGARDKADGKKGAGWLAFASTGSTKGAEGWRFPCRRATRPPAKWSPWTPCRELSRTMRYQQRMRLPAAMPLRRSSAQGCWRCSPCRAADHRPRRRFPNLFEPKHHLRFVRARRAA